MALAVRDVRVPGRPPNGSPLIFVGTLETHAGSLSGERDMVSSLQILGRPVPPEGSPYSGLYELHRYRFDGTASTPGKVKLWGLCGIAVGDVDGNSTGGDPDDELVLTTLNGDFVIFDLVLSGINGVQLGSLLQWSILDGSLGVCNSIVIRDFDGDSKNEVYVAGSAGIRKWKHP
jgi:hypothetical protein